MSTDPSGAAIGRVDAAVDELSSLQSAAVPPCDLADLAAAIEHVEALIAAGVTQGPDGSAAVERIADIAFVLHEREVEASLCDALDAAVREISDAGTHKQASAQRTHQVTELLRELSRRVNDMMALSAAEQRAEPPDAASAASASSGAEPAIARRDDDEDAADDEILRDGLFEADVREDDEFAEVVAALAASLPALADADEPPSGPQRESAAVAGQPPDDAQKPEPPAETTGAGGTTGSEAELPLSDSSTRPVTVSESSRDVFLGEQPLPQTYPNQESSGEQLSSDEPAIGEGPSERAPGVASPLPLPLPLPLARDRKEGEILSEPVLIEKPSSDAPSSGDLPTPEILGGWASPSQLAGEDSANAEGLALPEPGAMPAGAPAESPSHAAPETPVGSEMALAPRTVPPEGEAGAEAGRDDVLPRLEGERSRELLPESQPPVGPEEDPGDLFEPTADRHLPAPSKPMIPVAALAPSDLAATPEHVSAPSGERVLESAPDAPAAMSAPEAGGLGEVTAPNTAALALSPFPGPVPKPSPTPTPQLRPASGAPAQAVPRQVPNDPLAPVRALSEEEMIALFS